MPSDVTQTAAISVQGVSKSFRVPSHRPITLKERALNPFQRVNYTNLEALRDVSFEVERGEFFGIMGPNGSGKSTMLKLLAGIYKPDRGSIKLPGTVSPFIELGVGFNQELTAKDNVLINGTLLGLSRAEMARRFDGIIEFAGLEEFTEMKLKNYSSGMQVRLAFSTAIEVDADVILLDEVLAVGDAGFQEKCFAAFRRMKSEGRTIIFVSHSMEAVRRFCDRALLLDHGEMAMLGDPDDIAERYSEVATGELEAALDKSPLATDDERRYGDGSAEILECWVEDGAGDRANVIAQGEHLTLRSSVSFNEPMERPVFGIQVRRGEELVFASNTMWAGIDTPDFEKGERASLRIDLPNRFGVGTYSISAGVATQDGTKQADMRFDMTEFTVRGKRWTGGSADFPHEIAVETTAPRVTVDVEPAR